MGRPQKHTDREITFLTQDEVKRLFAAIKGKRDRALFSLAYHHGLRASEVGLLQTTDRAQEHSEHDGVYEVHNCHQRQPGAQAVCKSSGGVMGVTPSNGK